MSKLFVFTADLHLEDGAWSTRPAIYGDAYCSFDQIIDYCIDNALPLILGGDVLEKKSNLARPIAKLCAGLSRMEAAAVPVFYIQGNHEYDRNAPWLSVHTWPKHLHEKSISFSGVSVHGLDWLPKGEIQSAFAAVPESTDILITHQVWKDFMGNVGRTECELTDVHNVQTVLAGDFHVTKTVDGVNAQGRPVKMLSPGSTAMQDTGEAQDKFFFVIEGQPGDISFTPVPLKTRRFLSYTVREQAELDDLCSGRLHAEVGELFTDGLPPDVHKPIVKIKFDKQLPDAYLRLMTAVGESAHLFCEALTERNANAHTAAARAAAKNELTSVLAELLGEDTAAYALAAALLKTENIAKELDEQFSSYLNRENTDAALTARSQELGAPQVPVL